MHNPNAGRKTVLRFFSALLSIVMICSALCVCSVSAAASGASDYYVGDEILFGHYEQDNDTRTSAKKEDIAWIVIDKDDDGRLLLLSKYGLDNTPYQSNGTSTTWAYSRIREWLNNTFLKSSFSSEEQDMIVETTLENLPNHHYPKVDAGNITKDKVFLLSEYEAETYLTKYDRQCLATKYAQGRGTWTKKFEDTCCWWLRTPGSSGTSATYVGADGNLVDKGYNVSKLICAVRPAIWIDLGE